MHYTVPAYLPACCVSPCVALLCVQPTLPHLTSRTFCTYLPTYLPTYLTYPPSSFPHPIPPTRLGSHASRPVTARHKTGPSQNGLASPRLASRSILPPSLQHSPRLATIHRLSHDSKQTNIASSNSLPTASLTNPHLTPTGPSHARSHARTHARTYKNTPSLPSCPQKSLNETPPPSPPHSRIRALPCRALRRRQTRKKNNTPPICSDLTHAPPPPPPSLPSNM
jgi:hypothetical protein